MLPEGMCGALAAVCAAVPVTTRGAVAATARVVADSAAAALRLTRLGAIAAAALRLTRPGAIAAAALRLTSLGAIAAAALLVTTFGEVAAAAAQREPKGAEQRYEVTIAPPHRPGSSVAQPADANDDETPGAAPKQNADSAPAANAAESGAPAAVAGEPSQAGQAEGSTAAAAAATATAKAEGPRLTLQVGAYRQRRSAEQLRDKLAASFRDVAIVDATSGGEPLYRVRVGRLPKGPALEDMKRRLLAAGYPAFEIAAGDPQQP
ncbi:MAG: SPOR domain-containing protein [Deltaproteobacteria bacterium]|nr:SPOR domain-containing protein [Deltaproteobacteria bacterium]